MQHREEMKQLLHQKKALFTELEHISEEFFLLHEEELLNALDKRTELLDKISSIDEKIRTICKQDQEMRDALNHETHPESGILKEIQNLSGQVKASASRIFDLEDDLKQYLEKEKKRLSEKIQSLNKSGVTVAKSYHDSIRMGIPKLHQERNFRNL